MAEIRNCKICSAIFKAQKSQIDAGYGNFCSHKCAYEGKTRFHLSSAENLKRAAEARKQVVANHKKGEESKSWKGGKQAAALRRHDKALSYMREYRRKNPHMMAESARRRKNQKRLSRLPRGTVKRLGDSQRWMCIVCRVCIKEAFHVDHIHPLSKGGEHTPNNLQLLCGPCNVRKSAKDPIDFMQSRGYLL